MDVNMTASATTAHGAGNSAGVAVLKKALDIEAQNALLLIEAISQTATPASNLPPNLGRNINTSA